MYSGKTTVGRQLAQCLGQRFVDLDQLFEERYHTSIPLFFSRYGEGAFRQLEQVVLHSTACLGGAIVSTGGGTPCHFDNMQWINRHGVSVYLEVSVTEILRRAQRSRKPRPLLAGKSPQELRAFILAQLSHRLPYYSQAQIVFPADSVDLQALAQKILSAPLP